MRKMIQHKHTRYTHSVAVHYSVSVACVADPVTGHTHTSFKLYGMSILKVGISHTQAYHMSATLHVQVEFHTHSHKFIVKK